MDKMEKPHFEFSTVDKVSSLFGILISLFAYWISTWYWAIILLLLITLIVLIYNVIIYKKKVNSLYDRYSDICSNHTELAKQFDKKTKVIQDQNRLIEEYKLVNRNTLLNIQQGIIPITEYEKQYLKNVNEILLDNINYLYKLEGGNEDGKCL